jgi:hypothetical protein
MRHQRFGFIVVVPDVWLSHASFVDFGFRRWSRDEKEVK